MKNRITAALLCAAAGAAWADVPTEFPPGAQVLEGAALQQRLAGKVFIGHAADGLRWRMQYQAGGHLFVDVGPSYKDNGPWHAEASRMCATLGRTGAACSEIRFDGPMKYLKRASTGEVVTLKED